MFILIHSANLFLWIGVFNLITFNVIADKVGFMSVVFKCVTSFLFPYSFIIPAAFCVEWIFSHFLAVYNSAFAFFSCSHRT